VEEKRVFAARLLAFVTLLLNTGCDVVDAVLFDQANLTSQTVASSEVYVYRYDREKTGKPAVIPLADDIARVLLDVPMLTYNPEEMPFRCEGNRQADVQVWQYRVKQVLRDAGVKWVELPRSKDGRARRKAANVKQFRHTFAIRQLVAGQREETVARMLGHSDTKMIRSHYGAWVKERDDAHVREVIEVRAGL
jgi:integrase